METPRRILTYLGLAVAASLALAACGGAPGTAAPAPIEAPPTQAAPIEGSAGGAQLALPADIEITIYQGEGLQAGGQILLSELLSRGKPVVLNFYAGLCPPCRLEMPDLQKAYEQNRDEVVILGLDVGPFTGLGSREAGRALLQELNISYPAGTTFDADVMRNYRVLGMPTTYFIAPDGETVRSWTGILTLEQTNELIAELLAASENPNP